MTRYGSSSYVSRASRSAVKRSIASNDNSGPVSQTGSTCRTDVAGSLIRDGCREGCARLAGDRAIRMRVKLGHYCVTRLESGACQLHVNHCREVGMTIALRRCVVSCHVKTCTDTPAILEQPKSIRERGSPLAS